MSIVRRRWRRISLAVAAGALILGFGGAPSQAVDGTVVAAGLNYITPVAVMTQGSLATFANREPVGSFSHNVVSLMKKADGTAAFWTGGTCTPVCNADWIRPGQSVPIQGVLALPPGAYLFHCTLHLWMNGVLVVTPPAPAGTAS